MTLTTASLVEAIAHQLCVKMYGTSWDETIEFRRKVCLGIARAALEALRETAGGSPPALHKAASTLEACSGYVGFDGRYTGPPIPALLRAIAGAGEQ
jgi:hypothetical protein